MALSKRNALWLALRFAFVFLKPIQNLAAKPLISSGCFSAYRTDILRKVGEWSTRAMAEDMDLTWTLYPWGCGVRFAPYAPSLIESLLPTSPPLRAILPPLCCGSKGERLVSLEWRWSLPRAFNSTRFGRAVRAILLEGSLAAHAFDLIIFGLPIRFLGSLWRSGRKRLFWGVASAAVLVQAAALVSMVYWSR